MSFSHPYMLFGGVAAPTGAPADYRGAHGTPGEAVQAAADQGLTWWWIGVWRATGLEVEVKGPAAVVGTIETTLESDGDNAV